MRLILLSLLLISAVPVARAQSLLENGNFDNPSDPPNALSYANGGAGYSFCDHLNVTSDADAAKLAAERIASLLPTLPLGATERLHQNRENPALTPLLLAILPYIVKGATNVEISRRTSLPIRPPSPATGACTSSRRSSTSGTTTCARPTPANIASPTANRPSFPSPARSLSGGGCGRGRPCTSTLKWLAAAA